MAGGKRKRKRSTRQARSRASAANAATPAPVTKATATPTGRNAMARGYARAEEKNQAIRESLQPYGPGERPRVVIYAVIWLALLVANFIYGAITVETDTGERDNVVGRIQNIGLMLLTLLSAWGTWRMKYWALLGTQTLIAISVIVLTLFALTTSVVWLIPLSLAFAGASGWLFYRLVRVMARIQVAERDERDARRAARRDAERL
ncbi:MAG: hypothetical protein M0P31_04530 [Solirubrobacteraceae bacterium]|nr:hypothetical protein [Solirubrobacteraceae bacterium]